MENENTVRIKKIADSFMNHFAIKFFVAYFLFLFIGALLLRQPFSLRPGESLSMVDALFVSTSAITLTGLSSVGILSTFNMFGHFIILLLIQFGGITLVMMIAYFWLKLRKKINFNTHKTMINETPYNKDSMVSFIKGVIIMVLVIELIGFILLSSYFLITSTFTLKQSLFQALFMSISLFTNSGFSIAPSGISYSVYQNNYFVQSIAMILIFIGGIGVYPLYEVKEWLVSIKEKVPFKFSLLSKIVLVMHLGIWLVSAILFFGIENARFLADKGFLESVYYALFMSLSTRSAGFSTVSMGELSTMTQMLFMGLMFVGASPNSVGGGIRLTTFLLILLGLKAVLTNKDDVVIRERSVRYDNIFYAFVVIFVAIMVIGSGFVVIAYFESGIPITRIAFELVSAFGTTGLTFETAMVIGSKSKFVLIAVMVIGRIGILPLLFKFQEKEEVLETTNAPKTNYPEIDMILG
ncbi:TrkH family potassium uptake protein [Liberiplasma polymorphum]|uniref:TrkH family potassium uptake protein n=1 Tax=Liberiplasma polymorphum TaxID=3374570 RepID=UPI00377642DE